MSDPPAPVVFRTPRLSILSVVLLAVCATPVAFGAPYFWLIYLVPLGMIAWVVRVRTVADADALTVRRVVGSRRVPWSEISSLRLHNKARVRAVLTDGAELPLPAVHIRDLPQLAAASGGRLALGDD
jgi:Bacterial PH domain